jgi:hypothetical protein
MTKQEQLAHELYKVADNFQAAAIILTDAPDDFEASYAYALRLLDSFANYKASANL